MRLDGSIFEDAAIELFGPAAMWFGAAGVLRVGAHGDAEQVSSTRNI